MRVAGFRSSGKLPLVRLWTSPVPTWLTHASHVPSRSERNATNFPSREMARVLLRSLEIGQPRELRAFQRIPPEAIRALQLPRRRAADDQQTRSGRGPPREPGRTDRRFQAIGTRTLARRRPPEDTLAPSASSISRRASPMSRKRRFGSFSRQRWSSRRMLTGVCGRRRAPVGLAFEDRRDRVGDGLAAKRRPRRQHLAQHAAERPDVGPLVDRLARVPARDSCRRPCPRIDAFSCSVDGDRRHLRQVVSDPSSQTPSPARSRAPSTRAVRRDLDVGRFQIAVDDALLVRRFERLGDLARDRERLRDRQRTRARDARPASSPSTSSSTRPRDAVGVLRCRRSRRCADD